MICVLGMHRSGTSVVTGAISRLGAYVGPPAHVMQSRADNPEGFHEHQRLTDLNDEILHTLGGSWHEPPPFPPGWEDQAVLRPIRERAAALIESDFGSTPLWVWKDPRSCLTLPFWQPLLHQARYVLCLRSPLDVAKSMRARDGFSIEKGLDLWMQHTTGALRHIGGAPTLVVSYDSFVADTTVEVARLAAFLAVPLTGGELAAHAAAAVTEDLRHHRSPLTDVVGADAPPYAVSALHVQLRALAAIQRTEADDGCRLTTLGALVRRYAEIAQDDTLAAVRESALLRRELVAVRAEAGAGTRRLQASLDESERQRADVAGLVQYLQTPPGALKLLLRAFLPAPAHRILRRWGLRLVPFAFRRP